MSKDCTPIPFGPVLIFGVTGQDGSYLTDICLDYGHDVHGVYRRSSVDNLARVRHRTNNPNFHLHTGDVTDPLCVSRLIQTVQPAVIFNMADQDHIGHSLSTPNVSVAVTAGGVSNVLEAVRQINPRIHVFQPLSITIYGASPPPQCEDTPLAPQSPYACAKAHALLLCQHYRREHGVCITTGILTNHDSPRRSGDYLLHKICRGAVGLSSSQGRGTGISSNLPNPQPLVLGCLDMRVDIGYASEFMDACYTLTTSGFNDDFVIGTGEAHTIEEMVRCALKYSKVQDWEERFPDLVKVDPKFARPGPQPEYRADTRKVFEAIGFRARYSVFDVIRMLCYTYRHSK